MVTEQVKNLNADLKFNGIVGQSHEIRKVFEVVEKIANTDSTILINGETGTGKGLVAKAIHRRSGRADKPFISINCGAIPETLLESELFGHVRGAFTGATSDKIGKVKRADGGTIFFDEIGDMSPDLQVKILRILEENEFEQVGGNKTIKVDIRVIAATHRNLKNQIAGGLFREDLFFRLYVIPLELPALRNRKFDIPILMEHFLNHFNGKYDLHVDGFTEEAVDLLCAYAWPGNIRELKNVIERLAVLKQKGRIEPDDLPYKIRYPEKASLDLPAIEIADEGISFNTAVTEFEKALIIQSLEKANWVKNRAAKLLRLNRTTLIEKIKRLQLEKPDALARYAPGNR